MRIDARNKAPRYTGFDHFSYVEFDDRPVDVGNTERLLSRHDVRLCTVLHFSTISVYDDSMRCLVLALPSLFLPLLSNALWKHRSGVPNIYNETCHTPTGSCVSCSCKQHARPDLVPQIYRSTTASSAREAQHTITRTGKYPTSGLLSQRALNPVRHTAVPMRLPRPAQEKCLLQLGRRAQVERLSTG